MRTPTCFPLECPCLGGACFKLYLRRLASRLELQPSPCFSALNFGSLDGRWRLPVADSQRGFVFRVRRIPCLLARLAGGARTLGTQSFEETKKERRSALFFLPAQLTCWDVRVGPSLCTQSGLSCSSASAERLVQHTILAFFLFFRTTKFASPHLQVQLSVEGGLFFRSEPEQAAVFLLREKVAVGSRISLQAHASTRLQGACEALLCRGGWCSPRLGTSLQLSTQGLIDQGGGVPWASRSEWVSPFALDWPADARGRFRPHFVALARG